MLSLIFLISFASQSFSTNLHSGMKFVQLLYRHGDRTPCDIYPNDPYRDSSHWPVGFGQLTREGKMMHYELGQWLRQRYQGFLSSNFSEQEIYVRSTDLDRTLMSAQSNLAGLFPPAGYWKWNPELAWQPIPIHTVPISQDTLLYNHHTECPKLDVKKNQLKLSTYMASIYTDNKALFDYISIHSGWSVKTVTQLDYIYDSLLVESRHNKTLPQWTHRVFPGGKFEQLRNMAFLTDSWDEEMKRLQGGPFVRELVNQFDAATGTGREGPQKKMVMYSAHDTTISYVLNSLGVYNGLAPPYASLVMFELVDNDGWAVKISYRNETDKAPYVLTVPGCQQVCPLEQFRRLTEKVRPGLGDWAEECRDRSRDEVQMEMDKSMLDMDDTDTVLLMVARLVGCMAVVVVLVLAVLLCCAGSGRDEKLAHYYYQKL